MDYSSLCGRVLLDLRVAEPVVLDVLEEVVLHKLRVLLPRPAHQVLRPRAAPPPVQLLRPRLRPALLLLGLDAVRGLEHLALRPVAAAILVGRSRLATIR